MPLSAEIARRIAAHGPMPVAEYMALCAAHYYGTRDPLGRAGDFVTAPEVSQMFGELIGLWMAAVWQQMGAPKHVRVIELGPGRGTLMVDAIRAVKILPAFREAISLHLVETSPVLRQKQEETLRRAGVPLAWHAALDDVPGGPAIVVANEFFDALPVHQAVKRADGWHERCVGLDGNGKLVFTETSAPIALPDLPYAVAGGHDGAIFEWRDKSAALGLGARLAQGGAALAIDYGHERSAAGDTLQAVSGHSFADPLDAPGERDLTAHVDFDALARDVTDGGAKAFGPLTQGELLRRLGIEQRAEKLKANASPAQRNAIDAALARLAGTGRNEMGRLFKAIAFAQPSLGTLPGFEQDGYSSSL